MWINLTDVATNNGRQKEGAVQIKIKGRNSDLCSDPRSGRMLCTKEAQRAIWGQQSLWVTCPHLRLGCFTECCT
jgi:hypothetical protein